MTGGADEASASKRRGGVLGQPTPEADKPLFQGFLALLVWLPLPLGSNRTWAWSIMVAWVYLLGAGWLWGYLRGAFRVSRTCKMAWPVHMLLAVWLLLLLFQLIERSKLIPSTKSGRLSASTSTDGRPNSLTLATT